MILCTGLRTTIIQEIQRMLPGEVVLRLYKRTDTIYDFTEAPPDVRLVLAGGYLAGKAPLDHTPDTADQTLWANYLEPAAIIHQALGELPQVRICVVGSQSAEQGSYDTHYAEAKAKVHRLVQRIKVEAPQQLVAVAPGIIADSGMTSRRVDYPGILDRRSHCHARHVAAEIISLLWEDPIVRNNQIVNVEPTVVPGCGVAC